MINHARTLLVNAAAATEPYVAGEELIDPGFLPVQMPTSLRAVRRVLFGDNPDRHMLNYRTRELLQILHACELEEFVTRLDTRISYSLRDNPFTDPRLYLPVVLYESPDAPLVTVLGSEAAAINTGRLYREWYVRLETTAEITELTRDVLPQTYAVSYTAGLSNAIPLGNSGLSFKIAESVYDEGDGPRFRIRALARPAVDLSTVASRLAMLGDEVLSRLFLLLSPAGQDEPMLTFRRLFFEHYAMPYRIGGATLALIYQTEAIRSQ